VHVTENAIHTVHERRPAPSLANHVVCTWIQTVSPHSTPFTHRTSPHGSVELVCVPGSLPRIVGPQTGPLEQRLAPGTTIVGVRLRPDAAATVLGMPTHTVRDLALNADDLWGDRARALQDHVGRAESAQQAVARLERAVADRVADAPAADPVVGHAVRHLMHGRHADVAALAGSLFISERQLRRRFEVATGLTPTTLHRILRFQRFLALAWSRRSPSTEVAGLAFEAGYADQAHLSREAARLEGRSPRSFLSESELRCNCGHDHSASYGPLLRPRDRAS
jgi:AraC-like DNA-binding protein